MTVVATPVHCMVAPGVLQAVRQAPQSTTISSEIQRRLAKAFAAGLGLDPSHAGEIARLVEQSKQSQTRMQPVALPKLHAEYLALLKRHTGFSSNRLAYALCELMDSQPGTPAAPASDQDSDETQMVGTALLRPHQKVAVAQALAGMRAGKIVALEASTGAGKSRILAYAAAAAARHPAVALPAPAVYATQILTDAAAAAQATHAERWPLLMEDGQGSNAPVAIAAPTVAIVVHLMREWDLCSQEIDPMGQFKCAALFGRQQFVDRERLAFALDVLEQAEALSPNASPGSGATELLSQEQREQIKRLHQWLDAGMPSKMQGLALSGMVAQAQAIAPDLVEALGDIGLSELSDADALKRYEAHREAAARADVIFTTHATLCLDTGRLRSRRRGPILPPLKALLIDEAHQLESAQESVSSATLSMALAIYAARQGVGLTGTASRASRITAHLVRAEEALRDVRDDALLPNASAGWERAREDLLAVKDELNALFKHAEGKQAKEVKQLAGSDRASLMTLQRTRWALEALLVGGRKGVINHSPVLRRVSLHVGNSTIRPELAARWAVTPAALLTSGTLMTRNAVGWNLQELFATLAIEERRLVVADEIAMPWLYSTPTLYTPHPDCAIAFVPASAQDPEIAAQQQRAWNAAQARVIARAADDAAGGMLVLCTGHDRLADLYDALMKLDAGRLAPRLVRSQRDRSASAIEATFRALHAQGVRPIWIATGAAWTGLDLSDRELPPERDFLLTDLVISAVPYNIDHSLAAKRRRVRVGFAAERTSADRQLRQGIGRLVRREGLLKRRLWILDGRLVSPTAAAYTGELRGLLSRYLNRSRFKL